jgi:hypothetical protein
MIDALLYGFATQMGWMTKMGDDKETVDDVIEHRRSFGAFSR